MLGRPANADRQPIPEQLARTAKVKALQRGWQETWHAAFDADATLRTSGDDERPDPLPTDLCEDFRLIFNIRHAEPQTRAACFAVFPKGAEMLVRYESYLAGAPSVLYEAEARAMVPRIAEAVAALSPVDRVTWDVRSVRDRKATDGYGDFSIDELLENVRRIPSIDDGVAAGAAEGFLIEPLYASAGNDYILGNWVTSVLFQPELNAVFDLQYQLWRGGWSLWFFQEEEDGPDVVMLSYDTPKI